MSDFSPPRRILVTRTDRIGDVILSSPVFGALRETYPRAFLAAMVAQENAPLVRGNPCLDRVLLLDKRGRHKGWRGMLALAEQVRNLAFDCAIHLHPTNRVHVLTWLARIPVRIGYRKKMGMLLTHAFPERKAQGLEHEARYNFDLLAPLGISPPDPLTLHVPREEAARLHLAQTLSGALESARYAVYHPSASCPSKRWPAERFARVADEVASRYGLAPVIIGDSASRAPADLMQQHMRARALDLAGRLDLGMLAWLLSRASLVVSNDSGPVHMAAAFDRPVVAIFGRTRPGLGPARWGPLGERSRVARQDVGCMTCLAHLCEIEFLCLKALGVDQVLEKISQLEGAFLNAAQAEHSRG